MNLTAPDGHTFSTHVATPLRPSVAGLVVVQEIFGVNHHIRQVADGFAADGFLTIAPSLFDRAEPQVELGYDAVARGMALKSTCGIDAPLQDIAASVAWLKTQGCLRVGVVGYCWGGLLSWLSAARLSGVGQVSAAVCYYGGGMPEHANEAAQCPVMAHFGDEDQGLPLDAVGRFHAANPEVSLHLYRAKHGFNCDQRASHDAPAATRARANTLAFFTQHLLQPAST